GGNGKFMGVSGSGPGIVGQQTLPELTCPDPVRPRVVKGALVLDVFRAGQQRIASRQKIVPVQPVPVRQDPDPFVPVFHKAFDECSDLDAAAKDLVSLHIDRVLTSGAAVYPDILKGCERIHELYEKYGEDLQFLPGGGVRIENIKEVIKTAQSGQVHMTSKKTYEGGYVGLDEAQLITMLEEIRSL
ncbi:MAG: hypothetical protein II432_08470, partial [Erysipelotrichaceae bacterium]|nr:hypothetical protein [Erysipelotrichaceae bacterium]